MTEPENTSYAGWMLYFRSYPVMLGFTFTNVSVRRLNEDGTTGPELIEPPTDDDIAGWQVG
jgi:hypothetical protein